MSNLTTKEAAEFIRKCPTTIRRMVQDGRLRGFRTHPNGHLLFREADLLRAIGCEPEPAPTPKRGRPSLEPAL